MNNKNTNLHDENMVNHIKENITSYNTITDLSDFLKFLVIVLAFKF